MKMNGILSKLGPTWTKLNGFFDKSFYLGGCNLAVAFNEIV